MTSRFIPAVAAVLLSGCATIGTNYDPAIIDSFEPGMSKAQIITQLGRPMTVASLPDGRQQLMWVYSRGTMFGTARGQSVMLMFDKQGSYIGVVSQAETNIR
jgi:hypothetical protein